MDTKSDKPFQPLWVFSLLMVLFVFTGIEPVFAQPDGQKLFKSNCATCHTITDSKLVGPGLKGVQDRWADKDNLFAWIKNAPEYLKTGDPYAVALFEEYNRSLMTPFPHLKDEEIASILDYIANPPVKPGAAKTPIPGEEPVTHAWLGENDVIGIRGPLWTEDALNYLISRIDEVFSEVPDRFTEVSAP